MSTRPSSFAAQIDWSVILVGIVNEWTYHAILDRLDTGRGPSSIFHCISLVPATDLSLKEHLVALAHSDPNCASFDFGMPLQRFLDFPLYVLGLNARLAEIEASAIRVTVRERNKVLLEGKVGSWDERNAVENAAWSAPGVKSVEDRMIGPFVYDADEDD